MTQESRKRGVSARRTRVVSTRPNWLIRAIALAFAFHALFLISPWFDYSNFAASDRTRWYAGYLQSFTGRVILCAAELALAVLLWNRSTKRELGSRGRWYNRWPWD